MSATLALAKVLINRASVTPNDAGCQALIAERLAACGFAATHLCFADVDNLWLTHGDGAPRFVFLGHTDVVPAGAQAQWQSDPFQAEERDGRLYGRGAADMKGGIAAMVAALERFVAREPQHKGTLAVLLTSDEEGPAVNGTVRVVDYLAAQGLQIDWCLVGEPSSAARLGDVVKNGRRGSLNGRLIVRGKQGHTAYPQLADNPIHRLIPALSALTGRVWDEGNEHYPPSSLQVSNIHAGTGASNVIPDAVTVDFNLRFSNDWTAEQLQAAVAALLDDHALDYECHWAAASQPFFSGEGELLDAVRQAIKSICGIDSATSTAGGTSDGRFIAPTGAEVVELGPVNATIHQANECVNIAELDLLSRTYEAVLYQLMG